MLNFQCSKPIAARIVEVPVTGAGVEVRIRRIALGLSQAELAGLMGISRGELIRLEWGRRDNQAYLDRAIMVLGEVERRLYRVVVAKQPLKAVAGRAG